MNTRGPVCPVCSSISTLSKVVAVLHSCCRSFLPMYPHFIHLTFLTFTNFCASLVGVLLHSVRAHIKTLNLQLIKSEQSSAPTNRSGVILRVMYTTGTLGFKVDSQQLRTGSGEFQYCAKIIMLPVHAIDICNMLHVCFI